MKMWSNELNSKAGSVKISQKGKMVMAKFSQTQTYLKPLLRKLRSKTLPEDISDSLTEIVKHILDRNYIQVRYEYIHSVLTQELAFYVMLQLPLFTWQSPICS